MSNFNPLEVVGHSNETQVRVSENLKKITWCFKGKHFFNPLTAKLFNLNFHPLEVVSR